MTYALTTEQEQIQTVLRELLNAEAAPRASFEGGPSIDEPLWRSLVELGFAGLGLGESVGGMDAGLIDQVLAAEEIGRAVGSVPFLTSSVVCGCILAEVGGKPAEALAAKLAMGELIAATALPETRSESASVEAVERDGAWRLTGEVPLVLGGELAAVLLVPVVVGERSSLYAVDTTSAEVESTELPTFDSTRRAAGVVLNDAPADLMGSGEGVVRALRLARMRAQVVLAAEALGACSRALELATEHAKNRVQFGRPIGQFQAVKHRLADMLVDVENARSATYNAAWIFDESAENADLDVAMAKSLATENAVRIINSSIQIHGGMGVTWEDDLHLLLRRAKSCELFLGDPGFHLERIAGRLLDDVEHTQRVHA